MKHLLPIIFLCVAAACSNDIPLVNLGIDDHYLIYRMQKLDLHPALTGKEYCWSMINTDGSSTVLSHDRDYIFLTNAEGEYTLKYEIIDSLTPLSFTFTITVLHEEIEYSPFISRVYDYCPAPGQFVNEMPLFEPEDTYADILKKAEESICGTNDIMISLGGFGGYVTFGFDHTVVNIAGEYDFRIWGNCFYELLQPEKKGGSAEPGIVCVSYDSNCNGVPDDAWYELAGSEYYSLATVHNYSITYHRPDPDREIVSDEVNSLSDIHYIRWIDNSGNTGFMPKNYFHTQDYYPKWVEADEISFQGSCLAPNAEDISGYGAYYILYSYPWGYVDNHPNEYANLNSFDISWAVDDSGNPVNLPGIDFVRVYTGVNQYCGWIGETSTEICRAQDLHISTGTPLPQDPIIETLIK
ncbi:MAG: cell surface protein [Muribaculaceae bacterium]|nr:cell surface protein [Muribaculaceae bacterium]